MIPKVGDIIKINPEWAEEFVKCENARIDFVVGHMNEEFTVIDVEQYDDDDIVCECKDEAGQDDYLFFLKNDGSERYFPEVKLPMLVLIKEIQKGE